MIEKAVVVLLCLLAAYTSWVHGGSPHGYQPPILWITFCLWAIAAVDLLVRLASGRVESIRASCVKSLPVRILKDPFFYPSLIFTVLLLLQWFNAGRFQYFDHADGFWRYSEPLRPALPSAVTKWEAGEMFVWFLPPMTAALFIRNALGSRVMIRRLFVFMIINASLLGTLGIVQYVTKAPGLYWVLPAGEHFFASFGYQNHAGEFFFLMFCLGLGLVFRHVLLDRKARHWVAKTVLLALACVVMIASVHLALVAASSVLVWLVVGFAVVYAFGIATQHLSPATRLQILIGAVMLCAFAIYGITGAARDAVLGELEALASQAAILKKIDCRFWQVVTAWEMWKDYPLFGAGGWGYRYLGGVYLPPEARFLIEETGRGNVHNDTMQFLAEFGIVGLSMLGSCVGILFWRALRSPMWRHGLYVVVLLGLVLLYVHSMIDLPFRNPAILIASAMCLAGIGEYARLSRGRDGERLRAET